MALQAGDKLGPYEILALVGAGGMGEVYKASDTRLNRIVAIKILPLHFSENAEMKQRFEREAQTIAGLNHPNICTLFDVGHHESAAFLVMEFLDGVTLAERLERGSLPVEEALKVAIQIADAMDKAHRQGVVHRDLKPSNVMLTKTGAKLLDFGLAKPQVTLPQSEISALPTRADVTAQGTILGTLQYMAPEQLEGRDADPRTDIFAFGALLYEMVTGRKAFQGKSQVSLIAAIMHVEPPSVTTFDPAMPPFLDRLLRKCLEKDAEERWQSMRDVLSQLQWIASGGGDSRVVAVPAAALPSRGRSRLAWAIVAVLTLLVIGLAVPAYLYMRSPQEPGAMRFQVPVAPLPNVGLISVSPDGRSIAYVARTNPGTTALFIRPIDSVTAQQISGTDGANPLLMWSPDSNYIGFHAGGKLKKVSSAGGAPLTISDFANWGGGTWNNDGVIVFGAPNTSNQGLYRVSAAGGVPVAITELDQAQQETGHNSPSFLPDGNHYLYIAWSADPGNRAIYVGSLESKERTRLMNAESIAVFAEPGYILFVREGTLFAQPFDANRLSLTGEAVRIADEVAYSASDPRAAFGVSRTGLLIYRTGSGASSSNVELAWFDRTGERLEQVGNAGPYRGVDLSPDGKRIALHRHDGNGGDVWVFDAARKTMSRLTFDSTQDNAMPVWSPDGSRIAFGSRRNTTWGIYVKSADGVGNEELIVESELRKMPMSWSPDGMSLVYWLADAKTLADQWMVPLTGERKPVPILQTSFGDQHAQISPDGKWIAYHSNETGRQEVYIKSFPAGGGKWQVSSNGGHWARWRRDGKELYFMNPTASEKMMAVDITVSGSSIQAGIPHELFDSGYVNFTHGLDYHTYAVSADGQRFLIPRPEIVASANEQSSPITVVLNWTSLLQQAR